MKTATKLATLVGTIFAAGALAITPLTAMAADGDVDAGVAVGHTTTLTPVQLQGGTGSYSFASDACAAVSSDDVPPAETCTISASGTYVNIVCGTGTAPGTATVVEADGSSDTFGYSLTFVAGIGVVTGPGTPPSVPPVGVVVIVGTGVGAPSSCVTSFDVAIAAVLG